MIDLTSVAAQQMERCCNDLGVPLPRGYADARGRAVKARALLDTLPSRSDVWEAAMTAIDAGKDPASDPVVIKLAQAWQVRQAVHDMASEAVMQREANATRNALGEWIECVRQPFDKAAQQLTEARNILGNADLGDAKTILNMGANAAQAWSHVATASEVITKILRVWRSLAGRGSIACILAPDVDRWIADPPVRVEDPWEIATAGWQFRLNTDAEERQFLAEVAAETLRRDQAQTKRALQDFRLS